MSLHLLTNQQMKGNIQFVRSLRDHARAYSELGFNVVGIMEVGKGPYHSWKEFMTRRQTKKEALNHPWHRLCGIGVITGVNDYRCLDYDQCDPVHIPLFLERLHLPADYQWVTISGSGNGFHIWFRSAKADLMRKKVVTYAPKTPGLFKQIELRINAHVVMPPSLHRSGAQYKFWLPNDLKSAPKMID